MIIYILRHGQSIRNTIPGYKPVDCPLTELGAVQAEAAGKWLRSKGIRTMYCSPAIRALQTATIVSRHLNLTSIAWPELVEWGYLFDSPGLSGKELRASYPHVRLKEGFPEDVGCFAHKESETWEEIAIRAEHCLKTLIAEHGLEGGPILLVTHEHFARYFIAVAVGFQEVPSLRGVIQHDNCGVSALEITEERRILWYTNEHSHLGDLRSGAKLV